MKGLRAGALAPSLFLVASCVHTFGTPSLKHGVAPFRSGPNVAALVTHTNCEIARAIYDSTPHPGQTTLTPEQAYRQDLWRKLFDQTFVATVDFTLTATNTEGFDPSVSWVSPLTSTGKFVSAIPSVAAGGGQTMGTTMATYNRTLAVGIQANSTQDRNFDLTYLIDLHRLYEAVQQEITDENDAQTTDKPYLYVPLSEICTEPGVESQTSLDGNLELAETIDFGLEGLNKSKAFKYGAEGPVPHPPTLTAAGEKAKAAEEAAEKAAREAAEAGQVVPEGAFEAKLFQPPAGNAGAGGKTAMGPQSTNTTFSSKMDFTIVQGLNGGPSWQLLKWKIGGGSAGGGGGGGGGSGGGSGGGGGGGAGAGGGGGGGGGGQMFNWSRTVLDTLTITFAPTCSSVQTELALNSAKPLTAVWEVTPDSKSSASDWVKSYTMTLPSDVLTAPAANKFQTIVKPDPGKTSTDYVRVDQDGEPPAYGSVQWRGFKGETKDDSDSSFELLGTVSDPVTANPVGAIVLVGTFASGAPVVTTGHVTAHLHAALSGGKEPTDYWASIQSCDLSSAAQIQSAVKNASDTNTLFKLSNAQRQRLQQ